MTRAIDTWVNVNMEELGRPDYLVAVASQYFKQGEDFFRNYEVAEMTDLMDGCGVERAILTTDPKHPSEHVMKFAEKEPERFALGAQLDPRRGMKTTRALEAFKKSHNVVLARITPFYLDIAPDHAVYYPVYAKCIELDLPITINTGIPGPPAPGECQNPMHLDKVCLHFPELKLVMAHGADPWWSVAIRLMLKYPGLHLMTSAYLPKYLPEELLHFMRTRGKGKVIFASDHPAIQMTRCLDEARKLDLPEDVLDRYLYANAARLFWNEGD
ncbi:MAG: amidohydrolase [Deltaproteobacteria bacterium]|nr:amidohydrolase [Deltaproteobacteria bacterium]MBW2447491.1 amidohydrolase [Deltaproteobacteria bacterium]